MGGTAFSTNHNVTISASSKKTATMLSLGMSYLIRIDFAALVKQVNRLEEGIP